MKIRGEIIILCLIVCLIFSLSAVSAADDLNNATITSNNDLLSLPTNNNDSVLGSGGESFTKLNEKINGGSQAEISLTGNYTYIDGDEAFKNGIPINRDVTIKGNTYAIDGANKARIFNISSGVTVTLNGITFINGNASGGGGAILSQGTVNINNCRFIDNTANYANGGAVVLSGFGSTITGSYFEGNKAIRNPANEQSGGAGAVFINAHNVTIKNTILTENSAGLNGGAIGSSGNRIENCTIIGCTITNNTAGGSAGGVGMQSKNFVISDTTFKYNEAKGSYKENPTYPGNGGALVMRGWDSYAYNCIFINNTARLHGGAVFLTNTSYDSRNNNTGFKLCTFINNTAGYNGGAVDWQAGATHGYIYDSKFTNNTAKRSGGAVHWSGHYGDIINSTFTDNVATGDVVSTIGGITGGGDGGAVLWVGSHGIVKDCNFNNNHAEIRG